MAMRSVLKERDGSRHSLSRCIFAGSWLIVLAGALLTPAGLVYAGREHTKRGM